MKRLYVAVNRSAYYPNTHQENETIYLLADGSNLDKIETSNERTESRKQELQAYVKSGEYFTTLATLLDGISEHPELQQIVNDLMYLQQHYQIIKK